MTKAPKRSASGLRFSMPAMGLEPILCHHKQSSPEENIPKLMALVDKYTPADWYKGSVTQNEIKEKEGCNVPWAILLDPTSACNLHCTGCWAAEYGNHLNLSLETIDSIIRQGKQLGIYMYIYTGGEPLVRKKDHLILAFTFMLISNIMLA